MDEANKRWFLFVNVLRVRAEMPLAQPVEISIDFIGELLDLFLLICDVDLEVTARYLPLLVLAADEDHILGNHGNLFAGLALEVDFKFPVV